MRQRACPSPGGPLPLLLLFVLAALCAPLPAKSDELEGGWGMALSIRRDITAWGLLMQCHAPGVPSLLHKNPLQMQV